MAEPSAGLRWLEHPPGTAAGYASRFPAPPKEKTPPMTGGAFLEVGSAGFQPAGTPHFFGASPGTVTLGDPDVVAAGVEATGAAAADAAAGGGVAGRSLLM